VIVRFEQLQRVSHQQSKAAVKRYLEQHKIPYLLGTNGAPYTTLDAISRALLPGMPSPLGIVRRADERDG
jgi:hypothetical protein